MRRAARAAVQRPEAIAGVEVHDGDGAGRGVGQGESARPFQLGLLVGLVVAEHHGRGFAARLVADPAVRVENLDAGTGFVVSDADDDGAVGPGHCDAVVRCSDGRTASTSFSVEQGVRIHHVDLAGAVTEQGEQVVMGDDVAGLGTAEADVGELRRRGEVVRVIAVPVGPRAHVEHDEPVGLGDQHVAAVGRRVEPHEAIDRDVGHLLEGGGVEPPGCRRHS